MQCREPARPVLATWNGETSGVQNLDHLIPPGPHVPRAVPAEKSDFPTCSRPSPSCAGASPRQVRGQAVFGQTRDRHQTLREEPSSPKITMNKNIDQTVSHQLCNRQNRMNRRYEMPGRATIRNQETITPRRRNIKTHPPASTQWWMPGSGECPPLRPSLLYTRECPLCGRLS